MGTDNFNNRRSNELKSGKSKELHVTLFFWFISIKKFNNNLVFFYISIKLVSNRNWLKMVVFEEE